MLRQWHSIILIIITLFSFNVFAVNITITNNKRAIFLDKQGDRISLNVYQFMINDHEYHSLDIDYPSEVSTIYPDFDDHVLTFTIQVDGSAYSYTPPVHLQERLKRCIFLGMCSFSSVLVFPFRPTCFDFTEYLENGNVIFPSRTNRNYEIVDFSKIMESNNSSIIRLHNLTKSVHEVFYFGNGVCLSKLGTGKLYFHSLKEIMKFYEEYYSEPIFLLRSNYRDDNPPPPPSSGSMGLAM